MKSGFSQLSLVAILCLASLAAFTQDLSIKEKILMPGPLAAAHADFEGDCESCHSNFKKHAMTRLCLSCHKDVADDLQNNSGFHGISTQAKNFNCETCHKDHEGREADIVGLLQDSFNHSNTDFVLHGAHKNLSCNSCHSQGKKYRDAESFCAGCHQENDVHKAALGTKCENCHQANNWKNLLAFNHVSTGFPLDGKHQNLACGNCHFNQKFTFESTDCVSCHLTTDVHRGMKGKECENCHSTKDWSQMDFDHNRTDFPLLGKHNDLPCHACHQDTKARSDTPKDCYSCHLNDDIHFGRNGKQCANCHSSVAWKDILFKHNSDTDFPLTGKHEAVKCNQCHAGAVHDPLARDCASCHATDDVHHDPEMKICGTCHNTSGWNQVSRFDHDFSQFPLTGMHQIVPCENCHIGNQFAGIQSQCIACHKSEDIHQGSLGQNCNQCHTPNAWNVWQFDHEKHANYQLEGKHAELACSSCHSPGSKAENTSNQCGSCHSNQDIHEGGFGNQCGRCHNTSNFFELILK